MKVFAVVAWMYDNTVILGIYVNKSLAEKARNEFLKTDKYSKYGFEIETHEVQS